MKLLLAVGILLGSTVDALTAESYGDYRDYFEARPIVVERTPRRASKTTHPIDTRRLGKGQYVETYGYDDDGFGRTPDVRRHSRDGGYVPMYPRNASQDGFWAPIDQSRQGWELNQPRYPVRRRP